MIGLLTFHDTTNFGSYLQTYGLYKKIIDLGADCEIIDYQCESIVDREIPKKLKWSLNLKNILIYIMFTRTKHRKYAELRCLFRALMKHSERYDKSNIKEANNKYTTMLIGSDIVWGMDITKGDLTYFLDFADDSVSKNAYAASVGNAWSENEKDIITPLLRNFDRIFVRENEAANWVNEIVPEKNASVVCDPTMLLTANEWTELETDKYCRDDYVLVYFDTDNLDCLETAKKYATVNNLKVYYINYGREVKGAKNLKPTKIGDFLSLLHNAKFVITASYHGMLFSIYYNKQFLYYNRAHKSRMNTLADVLKVSDRNGELCDINNITPINYEIVNEAIDSFRQKSIKHLEQIIAHENSL